MPCKGDGSTLMGQLQSLTTLLSAEVPTNSSSGRICPDSNTTQSFRTTMKCTTPGEVPLLLIQPAPFDRDTIITPREITKGATPFVSEMQLFTLKYPRTNWNGEVDDCSSTVGYVYLQYNSSFQALPSNTSAENVQMAVSKLIGGRDVSVCRNVSIDSAP